MKNIYNLCIIFGVRLINQKIFIFLILPTCAFTMKKEGLLFTTPSLDLVCMLISVYISFKFVKLVIYVLILICYIVISFFTY